MSKMISVQTTGAFMLLDPMTRAEIEAEGYTSVPDSPWVQRRIQLGELEPEPELEPIKPTVSKAK